MVPEGSYIKRIEIDQETSSFLANRQRIITSLNEISKLIKMIR